MLKKCWQWPKSWRQVEGEINGFGNGRRVPVAMRGERHALLSVALSTLPTHDNAPVSQEQVMRARFIFRSIVSGLGLGGFAAALASCSGHGPAGQTSLASDIEVPPGAAQKSPVKATAGISAQAPGAKSARVDHIVWEKDYETALAKARATNKPVFIDLSTSWCGWCKELERTTYKSATVIAESQNFVAVKVDGDKRADLAQRYGVTGYPTMVIVDTNGKAIDTLDGYVTDQPLVQWMRASYSKFQPFVAV